MSPKNKMRFLVCFLFSTIAHSSVLVASIFFSQQIVEDPQGANLKESGAAATSRDHGVALVDMRQSKSAIPDSIEVADLARTLPTKTTTSKEILLAKEDDPNAVVIKKPIQGDQVAEVQAPVPTPTPAPKAIVKPKPEKKKIAKTAPKPKKVAAKDKKKPVIVPIAEPVKEESPLTENEKPVAVKERVDAEVNDQAEAPTAPQVMATPSPTEEVPPVSREFEQAPVAAEQEPAPGTPATKRSYGNSNLASEEVLNGGAAQVAGSGQGNGLSAGGSPQGIRDGDSLVELPGNIRPTYPLEDRRAKREGTAIFLARVTSDGSIKEIKLEGSATPAMNAAAQKAFANYHYKPGQAGWIRKKFVFKISGEAEEAGGLRRTSQYNSTSW